MAKLTAKQQKFVEEYLIDLNATQAAIRAGYSTKTAKEIGCENLSKPNVRACVDKAIAERSKRTGVNADRVVAELAKIALIKSSDVLDFEDATVKDGALDDDLAAIQSVRVKKSNSENGETVEREIRLNDKIKALELLGKHLGMFTDKVKVEGSIDTGLSKLDSIMKQLKE